MKRKLCFVLALILLCSVMLPACGSKQDSQTQEQTGDGPVEITFMEVMSSTARTEWLDQVIPAFEEEYNIKVNRELVPWEQAHDRLVTLAAAGNLPDVLETSSNWLSEFAAAGAYEDMQPYFDQWEHKDQIADIALRLGKSYEDTLYEMPYGLYIVTMMYRKDWLEEAGIPVPKTITEYYDAMAKVTDASQNRYGYALRGGMGNWGLLSCLLLGEMGTGDYFEEDGVTCTLRRPEAVEALEHFGNAYFNGYAPKDALNWGYAETVDSFTSGVTAFLVQDTEVIGVCQEKLGEDKFATAMAPAGSDGKTYLMAGHIGLSIAKNSKQKDAAWQFIQYMVSPDINAQWAENSWLVPTNKEALENPTFAEGMMAPVGQALVDPNVVLYNHPDYLPEWGEFYNTISVNELQSYLLGEQTAKETLDNISEYLETAQANYLQNSAQ